MDKDSSRELGVPSRPFGVIIKHPTDTGQSGSNRRFGVLIKRPNITFVSSQPRRPFGVLIKRPVDQVGGAALTRQQAKRLKLDRTVDDNAVHGPNPDVAAVQDQGQDADDGEETDGGERDGANL